MNLNRRELLAGLAGVSVLGTGAVVARRGVPSLAEEDSDEVEPVSIETVAAPGSTEGTVSVPDEDDVMVLDFFATTCESCKRQMGTLGEVADAAEATVLSITLEKDREAIRSFWETYDGNWLVGIDDAIALHPQFEVTATPTTVIIDRTGTTHWYNQGEKDRTEMLEAIEAATQSV